MPESKWEGQYGQAHGMVTWVSQHVVNPYSHKSLSWYSDSYHLQEEVKKWYVETEDRATIDVQKKANEEAGFFLFKKNAVIIISHLGAAKQFDGMYH